MRSLRLRLSAAVGGTVLVAWLATAALSYLDARARIGAMLDDHLVQAATLLLTAGGAEGVRPPLHWGHGHERHSLVYQGFAPDGRLLFRSADAPGAPLAPAAEGYSEVVRAGERWRVFGMSAPDGSLRVQVAEHAGFRGELAASVARHLLWPLLVALPLLALLVWLSVQWGLAPLRALAGEVARREPESLAPLDARDAPVEVRPLVGALDALFLRVRGTVEQARRFTADAAHELRTPLAAIRTHAEVARAARDDAERARALEFVGEGIDRSSRLVEQLLVLARLDARARLGGGTQVELRALAARQVAEAAALASDRGVNLGLVEGEEARVGGDADLLGVLVRNLVDNAIRYTPRGGRVDVSVAADGERAVLRVADSGPGVPAEERAQVLERFHRGRGASGEGSGLGLSIVARIAELHGASLDFGEGLGGAGLGVTVAFPRATSAAERR